ncbi:hypothetical protein LEN26_020844 [Aphanomyces euteiches]|nr:hypothetical protein LEN26_020844 [Aphanomyces euteiches]KAH9112931.1 hypothetical protein AeMF1_012816 [Aphanomyces euteiches]KAH9192700.1 hypothetical protein AeNC1_005312 [Aphanomyces euteiches]
MGNNLPPAVDEVSDDDSDFFIDHNDITLSFDEETSEGPSEDETVVRLLELAVPRPVQSSLTQLLPMLAPEHQRWYSSRGDVSRSCSSSRHKTRSRAKSMSILDSQGKECGEPESEPLPLLPLEESLRRNMQLSQEVKRLSMSREVMSMQLLRAHHHAEDQSRIIEREMERSRKLERKLELFSERYRLANEGMAMVKQKLNSMRVDFHQAMTKNKNLQGESIYSDMTVDDLEALEKTLEYGLSRVRTELRQQYRRAIDSERETCIICLHERVSIVVMPCRHRVLCATCAVRIQMCPVDRQEITDMFPTFGH